MTMRDRMEALRWSDQARAFGYTRVVLDTSSVDDQPELGDFLLIYARDATWAAWGVGCCGGGFTVWRPASGETVGWYHTLRRALEAVPLETATPSKTAEIAKLPARALRSR
jgi:hypothetical protein